MFTLLDAGGKTKSGMASMDVIQGDKKAARCLKVPTLHKLVLERGKKKGRFCGFLSERKLRKSWGTADGPFQELSLIVPSIDQGLQRGRISTGGESGWGRNEAVQASEYQIKSKS